MRIFTRIRKIPLVRKIIRLNKESGRQPSDSLKYIIFAHARTGSSILGDILNVHPKINLAHEPFRGKTLVQSELQVVNIGDKKFPVTNEDEFRSALNKIGWRFNGIKHIFGNIDEDFNNILLTKKDAKIIFLQRKNLLQSTVSMLISKDIQRWGGRAEKWRKNFDKQVFKPFEIKAIQNRIKSINKKLQYYKQILADNNVDFYNMYYEDLFGEDLMEEQKLSKVNEIFEFLGVGPLNSPHAIKKIKGFLNPEERKLNSEETYKQIPNYQEIEEKCGSDETGWLFKKAKNIPLILQQSKDNQKNGLKYMIFKHARFGSTSLSKILNKHSEINLCNEPFHNHFFTKENKYFKNHVDIEKLNRKIDTIRKLQLVLDEIGKEFNCISYGFVHLEQKLNEYLLSNNNLKIIFLERKNLLQTSISIFISKNINKWGGVKNEWQNNLNNQQFPPFDIRKIKKQILNLENKIKLYKQFLEYNHIKYFDLNYEDLFDTDLSQENKLAKINEIFDFLDVKTITEPAILSQINEILDYNRNRLNSEEIYLKIPNIMAIEEQLGSDETGWMFK